MTAPTLSGTVETGPRRRIRLPVHRLAFYVWCSLSYIFLLSPLVIVAGASLHRGSRYTVVKFPPEELSLYWYTQIPDAHWEALGLSFGLAFLSAVLACVVGVPAAFGLVRGNMPFKGLISSIFRAPLQIPSIVTGVAFLQVYYLFGDLTGIYVNGTFIGLLIGHLFVGVPYVVGTVGAVLQRFNQRYEEAALILGAGRFTTFRRVTLPVIMPGVYAGGLYAFMVSFGDVPISIFLSAPGFVTFPVELFYGMENDFNPAVLASSTLVILFSLLMLLFMQRVVGLENLLRSGTGSR
jgi:putative spermidine/putrescine transport system permease protein